ncbi:37-kD nucleoid-associated bacterial protein [Chryseobacterium sp. MOF25P]|uniref:nucleoid-associated protein n=1 Tax=unclassified Chryseobacterium TaxID=2593645 RepID=UPI000805C8B7|nr:MULTISPECIES: nucleoid-associated protein [unclassified Chryseobacterium]OBW40829.1 37-kD nucleoid-associated bacterial protein [Chryseobacterium sp. MOF25P]OBW45293.1 37-kD nucleoid-associated bacterial protein [Chryseobacterium sp. BGARF1]
MKIIAHKVGNKINGEGAGMADGLLQLDETKTDLLLNYFLGSFKSEETYQFYSDSYLVNNLVYKTISNVFEDSEAFIQKSKDLARLLYDAAENPRIQGGDLFVVYFSADNENDVDKIGIFKMEKKESFLKIFPNQHDPVEVDQGISLAKIDKAALIYNKDGQSGYVLSVVDNNKNGDMYYWFEDFLKVKQREDDYYQTQESMAIIKDYFKKQLPVEFEVSKADQADLLNKAVKYFHEKEEFNLEEFGNEVLEQKEIINSFNEFKTDYEQDMQINVSEEFPINTTAVKKSQKHFKSIIKLDKNFHLYIHGDKKLLEKGTDEKGNFYKVYFEKES